MSLISVIIPIYKVEKYLPKCVESVLAQTYKNIEIILVDDGSPDNCPQICDDYAKKYSNVKVIHKQNGGLSSARNSGIEAAKGEFLVFIDSDDYVANDMLEKLYFALVNNDADLSMCNVVRVDTDGNIVGSNHILKNTVMNKSQAFDTLTTGIADYVVAWNKLYKRVIFNTLRYPEGRIHEDEFVIHKVFGECEKVVVISDVGYYYVKHDGTITTSGLSVKRVDAVYAMLDRYYYLKDEATIIAQYALKSAYGNAINIIKNLYFSNNKQIILKMLNDVIKALRFNIRVLKLLLIFLFAFLKDYIEGRSK